MGTEHSFTNLKQVNIGKKIQPFKQGKTEGHIFSGTASVPPHNFSPQQMQTMKGGICSALAVAWIADRMSGFFAKKFSTPNIEKSDGSVNIHASSNARSYVKAAPSYLHYAVNADLDRLYETYKLKSDESVAPRKIMLQNGDADFLSSFNLNLAHAVLKGGCGALFSLSMTKAGVIGGHAVAFFRDSGMKLYFFDPNCGIYEVINVSNFFTEWLQAYRLAGYILSLRLNDGFAYFKK